MQPVRTPKIGDIEFESFQTKKNQMESILESNDMSNFSIESKNKVDVSVREFKELLPRIISPSKKIILFKPYQAYEKLKRDSRTHSFESKSANIYQIGPTHTTYNNTANSKVFKNNVDNDGRSDKVRHQDEASSLNNTRGSLLKRPIYANNEVSSKLSINNSNNIGMNMNKLVRRNVLSKVNSKGEDLVENLLICIEFRIKCRRDHDSTSSSRKSLSPSRALEIKKETIESNRKPDSYGQIPFYDPLRGSSKKVI